METKSQETITNRIMSIFKSREYGLSFEFNEQKAKFFIKGDVMYEDEENQYVATQTGIYIAVGSSKEELKEKWVICSHLIEGLFTIAESMSAENHLALTSNIALNKLKKK